MRYYQTVKYFDLLLCVDPCCIIGGYIFDVLLCVFTVLSGSVIKSTIISTF